MKPRTGAETLVSSVKEIELAVIGAGPAGLCAAIEAARHGVETVVFDENDRPGGQLFKQIHKFFGSREHHAGLRGYQIGKKLLKEAEELKVEIQLNTVVFGIYADKILGIYNSQLNPHSQISKIKAKQIILATGAGEKSLAFPGWTLPGVMGAGAAQTLVNIHRTLPGKKILMVGAGNVGLIVSYQLLQAGAEIVAIVEAAAKVGGYQVHADKIKRAGVPIYTSHTVLEVGGKESVEYAIIASPAKRFEVDTVCLAVGLNPMVELAAMLGCKIENGRIETSIPGIYAAGDVCGIEEASIAMEEGRLAGLRVAGQTGKMAKINKRLSKLRKTSGGQPGPIPPVEVSHQKPFIIIECTQPIPCDPCEKACKRGALKIGDQITNLPQVDYNICNGCGLCIPACPGLAIFAVDLVSEPERALVSLPYEYLPLPKVGDQVNALDKEGKSISDAIVKKVLCPKSYDQTAVITISVPKDLGAAVRGIKL